MAQAQLRSDITDVSLSPSQHWACLEGEPSDVPKYGFRSWANSPLDRYLPDPAIRSYGEKMSDLPTPDEEAPMTTTTDPALAILLSAHNPTSSARLDTVVRNAA